MATKSLNIREKAVEAALDLASRRDWNAISLRDIAKKTKIPLSQLHEHFDDRLDIIAAWGRVLDKKVLENAGTPDPDTAAKDRLFDVLMDRFDALNDNREGARSIILSLRRDPKQACIALPHLGRSMSWMLETAGIETTGWKGALKIAGVSAIYLRTLYVWCDDDSEDMAKTMAALDKNLSRASEWAGSFLGKGK